MRLDRLVANATRASRTQVTRWIRGGRVTVAGDTVLDGACSVAVGAAVAVDGRPLPGPQSILQLFHKPLGVHSAVTDAHGRTCLGTVARPLLDEGYHPVGRLDADTDGLLLFSLDGALTQWLLHPRRRVTRVYEATVAPEPGPDLAERLEAGISTSDGVFQARLLGAAGDRVTLSVTEGKYRMVRRVLANAGHPVLALRRIAYGPFALGQLESGAWRPPTPEELVALEYRRGSK